MKYQIEYIDPDTDAISPIDIVETQSQYTAEQYIIDCMHNADSEYVNMLNNGTVRLIQLD